MSFSAATTGAVPAWRDQALRRSLAPARQQSEARLERLLDAVRELTDAAAGADFTVADVAARAGVSLKSFYRCFAGKDELLLALLEEESTVGAAVLRQQLADEPTPVDRLHRLVRDIFELARSAPGYSGVLVREYRRLSSAHPDALDVALAPLVGALEDEIRAAAGAGLADPGDPADAAQLVFTLLLDGIAAVVLGRREPTAVVVPLWTFIAGGLRVSPDRS